MTKPTKPFPQVVDLQSQMYAAGLRLGAVLKEAGMHPGTWSRWTRGAEPKLTNLEAVQNAINVMKERADV